MKVFDIPQYSDEWWGLHCGIPTASNFNKILTPAQLKPSSQATGYMNQLLAEWLTGKPVEQYSNEHMERGLELEAEACDAFNFIMDKSLSPIGFITNDQQTIGCSPDRWGDEGLEAKCPSAGVHVGYLLDGTLPNAYVLQVQGSMMLTVKPHWWFMSYHPDLDPLILKVPRDERIISALSKELDKFVAKMIEKRALLQAKGYKRVA